MSVLCGVAAGFAVAELWTRGRGSAPHFGENLVLLRRDGRCWHVHHWAWCLGAAVALLVFLQVGVFSGSACSSVRGCIGILLGAAAQGLLFTDAFEFLRPCATALGTRS